MTAHVLELVVDRPRHPDEALANLGLAFDRLAAQSDRLWEDDTLTLAARERLTQPALSVVDRIVRTPARTQVGIRVKARVLQWILVLEEDDVRASREERLMVQIVRGLLELPERPPA